MAVIRATCERTGDAVEHTERGVTVWTDAVSTWFDFDCPACGLTHRKRCGSGTALLLLDAGCSIVDYDLGLGLD